jgi:hypothetical protein
MEKGLLDGVDPVLRLRLIQATLAIGICYCGYIRSYMGYNVPEENGKKVDEIN